MISFDVDPDYQEELDWADAFVRDEVAPMDLVFPQPYDRTDAAAMAVARPLMDEVRGRGLWACHLGPELGGAGYGQVKLALLNEILGRSTWAPTIFGCQAPDSGNAEILAHFGTAMQRERYLQPLLDAEVVSCFAMTEPQAGADPRLFTTRARQDGDDWVVRGEKWFASNAAFAGFFVVMVVTDPAVSVYRGSTMMLVPAGSPGLSIVRNADVFGDREGTQGHGYLRFEDVRVPADHVLGDVGSAFAIAQARLGGGRIHHAMRTVGIAQKAFDLMCERAASREVHDGRLGDLGTTQGAIAQSWIELEQFRLLVLRTAWRIDQGADPRAVRRDISAVKAAMPTVLRNIALRAMHLHGALGVSNEMPFGEILMQAEWLALADGPTEVHETAVAKYVLADTPTAPDLFPSGHLPRLRDAARARFGIES